MKGDYFTPIKRYSGESLKETMNMADKNEKSRGVRFGYTGGDNTINLSDKEPGTGALTVKVNIDVSEALTGLKAVQREAREAAKALRELEEAQMKATKGVIIELDGEAVAKSITDDITRSYGLNRGDDD